MSNLIPTPRTDKNGKTVIRHMRPDIEFSSGRLTLPAITLPGEVTMRQVKKELFDFLRDNTREGYPDNSRLANVEEWLRVSTGKQLMDMLDALDVVKESKTSNDPSVLREARVIRSIMQTTLNVEQHTVHAHDMLSFRSAFSASRATIDVGTLALIFGVYAGNRCDMHGKPLREKNLPSREGFSALLRYSFEVLEACMFRGKSNKAVPVNEIYINYTHPLGGTAMYSIYPYKNDFLAYVISENPDRVEDLVDLAIANETSDPQRLLALMNYDGPSALSSGAL